MEKSEPPFIILVMAGGTGSRMDFPDKGILMVQGKTLIQRNLDILSKYSDKIYISVSDKTGITEKMYRDKYEIIRTPGQGYPSDLEYSMKYMDKYPVLTVASDLYFEDTRVIDEFINFAMSTGKGVVTLLADGLFCGMSIFFSDPEKIGYDDYYNYDAKKRGIRNINTTLDFFALLNKINRKRED